MLKPQAAVIHKIDRTPANSATIDNVAVTLNRPTPTPPPPKATGLIAVLLAAVDSEVCYGVALFDTPGHATAAEGAFSTFWRITANLGNTAVHDPVVAAAVNLVAGAAPDARMVWVPAPLPVTTQLRVLLSVTQQLLVAAIRFLQQVFLGAVRRSQKP